LYLTTTNTQIHTSKKNSSYAQESKKSFPLPCVYISVKDQALQVKTDEISSESDSSIICEVSEGDSPWFQDNVIEMDEENEDDDIISIRLIPINLC